MAALRRMLRHLIAIKKLDGVLPALFAFRHSAVFTAMMSELSKPVRAGLSAFC